MLPEQRLRSINSSFRPEGQGSNHIMNISKAIQPWSIRINSSNFLFINHQHTHPEGKCKQRGR